MKIKLISAFIVCLLIAPLVASAAVSAKVPPASSTSAIGSAITAVKGAIKRCPIIGSKIQAKITDFDNSKIRNLGVYTSLKIRLATVADQLGAQGLDVKALNADLAVLDQKIAKFSNDYATYIAKLKTSQQFTCGKSEVLFKKQLKDSKSSLQIVNKDAVDVRTYVSSTIRGELNRINVSLAGPAISTLISSTTVQTTSPALKPVKIKPIVPLLPKVD